MDRYRQSLGGIVLFAVAGLLVSGYLSYLSLVPSGSCPVGEFSIFSCDRVIYSEYAHPFGIPVSLLGLGWFFIALWLALPARRNTEFMRYMVAWSLMGLVGVAGLVYVELALIGAICAFCTIAHACGLVILALSLIGWRSRGEPTTESTSERQFMSTLGLEQHRHPLSESVIEIIGLTKKFNTLVAVDHISLSIPEGEIFGLLGPNGAGKTTTLSMLSTLLKPTEGTGKVNGHDILGKPAAVRKSIGIVFQDPSSDDILTGRENLYLHALMFGVEKSVRSQRISEVLQLVDLADRADSRVKTYSGGMRRRLELARGLMHKPKILFLDEPTLGLDPQTREHIWRYIRKLVDQEHVTVVMTTHYMDEAEQLCDRVAIIDNGKVVALDTPERLKQIIGGDIIRLKVKNPRTDEIKNLEYVLKVEQTGDFTLLTVKDSSLHLPEILRTIGNVESVELRTPTLNDVFLHYTGHEIREEEPEGGFFERAARAGSN